MKDKPDVRREVMVDLGDQVVKLEALTAQDVSPSRVRVSAWSKDLAQPHPLDLTEAQLVTLLERAIRAGLISTEFIHNLRAEFEI
jgi:hypothetical protein